MKKIILALALAALSALSTASFAERKWDLRDSPESQGSFSTPTDRAANDVFANDTAPLAGVGVKADVQVKRTQAIDELYDAHGFRR